MKVTATSFLKTFLVVGAFLLVCMLPIMIIDISADRSAPTSKDTVINYKKDIVSLTCDLELCNAISLYYQRLYFIARNDMPDSEKQTEAIKAEKRMLRMMQMALTKFNANMENRLLPLFKRNLLSNIHCRYGGEIISSQRIRAHI